MQIHIDVEKKSTRHQEIVGIVRAKRPTRRFLGIFTRMQKPRIRIT